MSYETQEILDRLEHIQKYIHQLETRIEDLETQLLTTTEETEKTENLCDYCKASGKDCTPENCILPQEKTTP